LPARGRRRHKAQAPKNITAVLQAADNVREAAKTVLSAASGLDKKSEQMFGVVRAFLSLSDGRTHDDS
jgi:hypothetical protein